MARLAARCWGHLNLPALRQQSRPIRVDGQSRTIHRADRSSACRPSPENRYTHPPTHPLWLLLCILLCYSFMFVVLPIYILFILVISLESENDPLNLSNAKATFAKVPQYALQNQSINTSLILPMLRLILCPKHKEAKMFENHLNHVMLVFIR